MKTFPFATLVTAVDGNPYITHIPVIYNENKDRLVIHMDALNPQVNTLRKGSLATAIYQGPNCYISPSVYTTDQFPTWNYIIVHVEGIVHPIEDEMEIKQSIVNMTNFLEGSEPKFVLDLDHPRMDRLLPHIRAFEIEIDRWEGKFKLSQDKNPTDFEMAKTALKDQARKDWSSFVDSIYDRGL